MNFQPPDPVCAFCGDHCAGTCEGARDARERAARIEELQDARPAATDIDAYEAWLQSEEAEELARLLSR